MEKPTSKAVNVVRSAGIMAAGTAVSRILGFVRTALLLAVIGKVGAGDAFQVANTLPNLVYNLIASSVLSAVLVPQIVRALKHGDEDDYINRLLTLFTVILLGITVVAVALAPLLVDLFAVKLAPAWWKLALALAFWCLPQIFFYGMYSLWGQLLNAMGRFGPYMWAPVVNNVVGIAGLLLFIGVFGRQTNWEQNPEVWTPTVIAVLGFTTTLGIVAQALILLPFLKKANFRLRFVWGFRGYGLGRVSRTASWAFYALLVGQVGFVVISNVAAAANGRAETDGANYASLATYNTAFMIYHIPVALVVVSLITALFTKLSQYVADGDLAAMRDSYTQTVRGIGLVTVFCSAALFVAAFPVVRLIIPGADPEFVGLYGSVVAIMALYLPFTGVWNTAQTLLLAQERTKTSFFIQLPMTIMVSLIALGGWMLLHPAYWVRGIAVAELSGWIFACFAGHIVVSRVWPSSTGSRIFVDYLKYAVAILPATVAGLLILHYWGQFPTGAHTALNLLGAFGRIVLVGTVMLSIYVGMLVALRSSGLAIVSVPIRRRLGLGRKDAGEPVSIEE
ncbi:MAG: murein biosynthesis integral membrane protein MurJ [Actinomycetaceae bacterium]|nr:murein biosynthesis integral membrane protein MurJ [Actinomycetaceae bacterium]